MQTRVIVSVMHPRVPSMVRWQEDRGAAFRDAEDIQRVTNELVRRAKERWGEDADIRVDTRET